MTTAALDDSQEKQDFKIELASKKFLLKSQGTSDVDKQALKAEILEICFQDALTPIYEHLCNELGWTPDPAKIAEMKATNQAKLQEIDDKIKDAEENMGETEVKDAMLAKADYYAKIGDKPAAVKAYQETAKKTAGAGNKIDLILSQIRLDILYGDWHSVKKNVTAAKLLSDEGGDWERKNKLKVYEGLLAMYLRDFKLAAELFLESIATFTTYELFPYSRCIFYAVLTSMICLDRPALKKTVVDAPEVLSVIHQIPSLSMFLNSMYFCKYHDFFKALVEIVGQMQADMYLQPHVRYYQREIRALAYTQFLESYKSVTMASMASAFGVSMPFVDAEISEFIVAGRLHAKIDKVAGIIESKRPDTKNALYQDSIKKGDLLLNRIQKLSKVIDVE